MPLVPKKANVKRPRTHRVPEEMIMGRKTAGDENREKVLKAYTDYVRDYKKAPSGSALSKIVGLSIPSTLKHMETLKLKEVAKERNADIVARHYKALMDEEKLNPTLLESWYRHFGVMEQPEDQSTAKKESGKIVINIVSSKGSVSNVEEAEIVQE